MAKKAELDDPVGSSDKDVSDQMSAQVKGAAVMKPQGVSADSIGESNVSLEHLERKDLSAVSLAQAKVSHPFAGYPYPFGKEATMLVSYLKPVAKDPSNEEYTVREELDWDERLDYGPYTGKTLNEVVRIDPSYAKEVAKAGKAHVVNLDTTHSRVIYNYETGQNEDVVFDRTIKLKDGEIRNCASVPSHNVRAQIIFDIDPRTGLIRPNQNYGLLDLKQSSRLLRIVQQIARPLQVSQQLVEVVEGTREQIPTEHQDLVGGEE